MKFNGSFGSWLRQRRKALDLTQQDLADQIGYSEETIRKIEGDERRPSKQATERMADVLAISLDERAAFVAFARPPANDLPALPTDWTFLTPTHNLPPQSTPFVGRQHELTRIAECLCDPACRLLTLVGPGGIGKTRLALQAASNKVEEFVDGVFFVSLTPVGSPGLIASAIASALKISFYDADDPNVQLLGYLSGKEMLLILDNFEHLLEGVGLLTDILANAPRLKILVTSRERLSVHEEWALPIEGLSFPDGAHSNEVDSYSAIQLFVQSARRVQPDFSVDANQSGVIDICRAVEGMPLGIELAATWLRAMPCHQIAGQIRRDLDFLASPLRNVPERHRSLRAVFEHSWNLLSEVERRVLAKLSVFRSGFDLEAAEQVAETSLTILAGLTDKSLIHPAPTGRYDMHELFRQFAADKLLESNEMAETERRHFEFFLCLAEQLERRLFGPEHVGALDRLEAEHDNFRVALDWASRAGDAESGLRLAGALGWFWDFHDYWNEGRGWLEKFRAASKDAPVSTRATALYHTLQLSMELGDTERMAALCEETLTLVHELDDQRLIAWLLVSLGFAGLSERESFPARLEQALTLFRKLGDNWGTCKTLGWLALAWLERGNFARAGELLEEGIRLARQSDDRSNLSWGLMLSGRRNWHQGIIDWRTESLFEESLALFRELRYIKGIAKSLYYLGRIAYRRGEDERAMLFFEKSLTLHQQIGEKHFIASCLVGLAEVFCARGALERGARLLGAVSNLIQAAFSDPLLLLLNEEGRMDYERGVAAARSQLGEAAFAVAYAKGQIMMLDQAVAHALEPGN